MNPIRLMLVDDHDIVRTGLKSFLDTQEGLQVVAEASSGEEAIEKAQETRPDVIVMDITMPEMDGFGVLFSLRENVTTSKIPFIFLTASTRTYDRQWGVELGANDYITKPFKLDQLLEAIRKRLPA